ncbi:hypothetical protein BJ875DRAFT_64023 [Amylocarpus encephaloides]|uniref:Uncharacterized protein n=1 Tax=Amylocarpus encephaloides TaxID=45428 RepID=A0A9P7YQV3_9HELO|nr:hypothetical protein BJ875DRAFT_64023 [Amylocarpus encephaloides]
MLGGRLGRLNGTPPHGALSLFTSCLFLSFLGPSFPSLSLPFAFSICHSSPLALALPLALTVALVFPFPFPFPLAILSPGHSLPLPFSPPPPHLLSFCHFCPSLPPIFLSFLPLLNSYLFCHLCPSSPPIFCVISAPPLCSSIASSPRPIAARRLIPGPGRAVWRDAVPVSININIDIAFTSALHCSTARPQIRLPLDSMAPPIDHLSTPIAQSPFPRRSRRAARLSGSTAWSRPWSPACRG